MRSFKNIGIILSFICFISGCASFQNTGQSLPKCNGYSKRPLNKSMWNWEGKNPQSPQFLYKNAVATISIKSISFISKDVTQVRYYKTVRENNTNKESITHWVATLTFRYSNAPISTQNRLVNPLGFMVREYRTDPEVVN